MFFFLLQSIESMLFGELLKKLSTIIHRIGVVNRYKIMSSFSSNVILKSNESIKLPFQWNAPNQIDQNFVKTKQKRTQLIYDGIQIKKNMKR